MGSTMYIKSSNTLTDMQPRLSHGDTNTHRVKQNAKGKKCKWRDFNPEASRNLNFDTVLDHQLSQKLKLLENWPTNVYQAIQHSHPRPWQTNTVTRREKSEESLPENLRDNYASRN